VDFGRNDGLRSGGDYGADSMDVANGPSRETEQRR